MFRLRDVRSRRAVLFLACQILLLPSLKNPTLAQSQATVVPGLVRFSGIVKDVQGKAHSGIVGVTFALYKDEQGGAPLWLETQSVQADSQGRYTVSLGATLPGGLPQDLFVSGEARWLGVQPAGLAEQPRTLLLSVPYAIKAGDAQTIGGLPPSAFVLATSQAGNSTAATPSVPVSSSVSPPNPAVTGAGALNFIPLWDTTSDILNSILFQSGSGATARIGINTTTPAATLDVKGAGTFRGALTLPSTAPATAAAGKNSQPLNLIASAFNSGTQTPVNQSFRFQAEPLGNNTTSANATLNLLYAIGAGTATETGLKIASNGQITFASGQTFPGTGSGTVTSVGSGAGLTGGPITGGGSLSIASGGVSNAMLQNPSLTVNASSPLTGGGSVALGGSTSIGLASCASGQILKWTGSWTCSADANSGGTVKSVATGTGLTGGPITNNGTLSINTAVVPQLGADNSFIGANTFAANNPSIPALSVSNGIGDGIYVISPDSNVEVLTSGGTYGVYAQSAYYPVVGTSGTGPGIYGDSATDQFQASGIYGVEFGTTQTTFGVFGASESTYGAGVFGIIGGTESSTGADTGLAAGAGIWGDGGSPSEAGVLGTADDNYGVIAMNTSFNFATLTSVNWDPNGYPFDAYNVATQQGCNIDPTGNLTCTGMKNTLVAIDSGRKVALTAIESPQNWFEDFGSAQLVNGVAIVRLDSGFVQTVNTVMDYKVFPVPNGDCKGLYVTHKTANSFEVRELGGGTSNVTFDYRITALRRNFENIRLADHTNDPSPTRMIRKRAGTPQRVEVRKMIPPALSARSMPVGRAVKRTVKP